MLVSGLTFPSWFDPRSMLAPNIYTQPLLGSPTWLWLDVPLPSSLPYLCSLALDFLPLSQPPTSVPVQLLPSLLQSLWPLLIFPPTPCKTVS